MTLKKRSILSTKSLTKLQKDLLLNVDLNLVEHSFIKVHLNAIKPQETRDAILTSQNAVKGVIKNKVKIKNAYCVGQKTAALAEKFGIKTMLIESDSKGLAEKIVDLFSNKNFTFYCGNLRADELPDILTENKVTFEEITTYKTMLNPKKFEQSFDGILFFSPSAIESFLSKNKALGTAFCIGETSARLAKKYFKSIVIAQSTSIESLIKKAINHFKT